MDTRTDDVLPLRVPEDIVMARQLARAWAVKNGFSIVDQTKIVTATSELARNVIVHGGGGEMRVRLLQRSSRRGLELSFLDQGPGIPDVELALTDGYTTNGGMGLGLGGSRRLMNEFMIDSKPGNGTRVSVVRWT